jgi:hypothetical protein
MPLVTNPGSGGATFETRTDENGYEWVPAVASYLTHASTGEGDPDVLQYVDDSNGLPVSQVGAWTMEVSQPTAANLKATVNIAASQTIAVTQGTASSLLCTASQGGTWTVAATQSGTWTVAIASAQTIAATQSGTWNVGTVTSVTTVGTITNPVTVAQSTAANLKATVNIASGQTLDTVTTVGTITNPVALAAGANLVGKVSNGVDTSTIYNGTTALTPKFAKISASSSGDNTVVSAVTGKKIRVLNWALTANGTVSIKWRSNTTDITGLRPLIQYASAGRSGGPTGVMETSVGEALNLNLSAAVSCGGELQYLEI